MSIWSGLFGRRNVKLSGRDDAETLRTALAANGSAAGKSVTVESVLSLSTAWACIRLLAETIGTLPIGLFERAGDEKRPAKGNDLYGLLHDSPNAWQTAAEFWEGIVAGLCLWGNGYAEKQRVGTRVVALEPMRPDLTKVKRTETGVLQYRYADPTGERILKAEDVFHVRGFGVGGDVGLSPISYARQTMGIALAADDTAASTFKDGLQLSGFLEMAGKTTPQQREELVALFQKFAGVANSGKVMPLPDNAKFVALTMKPEDAQLLESRSFNVEEICRWFRVPPFMVGHTDKSTSWGTGLEQQMIGFLTFSLRPYLTRIEQAAKKQLIAAGDREKLFIEFNLEGLLRADSAGRAALYSTFAQNGISTRNEIRARENMPRVEGGDSLTVQSNLVPIEQLGKQTPAPPRVDPR